MRGLQSRFRPILGAAVALAAFAVPAAGASAFEAGAAKADITPPLHSQASDAAFVPACGTSPAQVAELWPGPRSFAFEKPYVDAGGHGRYVPGDPYCDANHSGRYEAPYLAGGSGQNRWPLSVDPGNGPEARALVFAVGKQRDAVVSVDSIGLFDVTMEQIRERVRQADPSIEHIFVSSTHDESAPDPIGLWGPNASEVSEEPETPASTSSGVDGYYMQFLVERVAQAVIAADQARRPATLRAAVGSMPSNVQSCWSSYPYTADESLPVMQARARSGAVIFTLADVGTHAETLGFSRIGEYTSMVSADWPGKMRAAMEARWPGSVGVELAGMVGSVETPTVYEPESTQVPRVPEAIHGVSGNPNGCSSVYPQPATGTPVSDAHAFLGAYGTSIADAAAGALETEGHSTVPAAIDAQQQPLCVPLENNFFVAAYGAGLFAERQGYADAACTVKLGTPSGPPAPSGEEPAMYLKSAVGVLTLGKVQLAYSPGEVFPFTEIRGPIDQAQMPFPTNCYEASSENYECGSALPMTAWTSAQMTQPYRFLVGLGEDMVGYMFPPGNFVGAQGEVAREPWASYEATSKHGGHDRFGHGHADDAESAGPYLGLQVTNALQQLLAADGRPLPVEPGLYVDAQGRTSDSPFAGEGFGGAVGVKTLDARTGKPVLLLIGAKAKGWATFDGQPDPGTAGTSLPYSVRTAGVLVGAGKPLLIDVYAGAQSLG